jgi:signal transduction histidine kinase
VQPKHNMNETTEPSELSRRLERLLRVTSALSEALTPVQVAEVAVRLGVPALGAVAGSLSTFDAETDMIEVLDWAGYPEPMMEEWQRFSIQTPVPIAHAMLTGKPQFYGSRDEITSREVRDMLQIDASERNAWAALPLNIKGSTIGVLALSFAQEQNFDPQIRTFALSLAEQCAQALDRARLYEAERQALAAANESRMHLSILAEVGAVLVGSLNFDSMMKNLLDTLVPALADWCGFELIDLNLKTRRTFHYHRDPLQLPLIKHLQTQFPLDDPNILAILDGFWSQLPLFTPVVSRETTEQLGLTPDQIASVEQLRNISLITVPLAARARIIGTLTVARVEGSPHFTDAEFALTSEVASRVALAADNALLFEQLQQAALDRDNFMEMAAHELKTPVTSLRGYIQLLLRQIHKGNAPSPDQLIRTLTTVDQQTERLTRLIRHLLDAAMIADNTLKLFKVRADLVDCVAQIVQQAQESTNNHEIRFHAPDSLVTAFDSERIGQTITNLLDNAIRYSPDGGVIDVSVTVYEHDVMIVVTDPGIGIPPEHREHIFSRFYQAHEGSVYTGMGLSLYVSRTMVEMHGGTLVADFPPEGGTQFILTLPIE